MSSFSPAFREHLDRECTTLCHCWRVARRDGQTYGFTDHDRALTVDGQTFEPESGFAQSEARTSLGMAPDSVDVEGALSSDRLTEDDIQSGLFDGATVETLLVNWCEPEQFATIRTAVVGKMTRADGRFVAELESVAASLDGRTGAICVAAATRVLAMCDVGWIWAPPNSTAVARSLRLRHRARFASAVWRVLRRAGSLSARSPGQAASLRDERRRSSITATHPAL